MARISAVTLNVNLKHDGQNAQIKFKFCDVSILMMGEKYTMFWMNVRMNF